ncbi:unnamed protein product [Musa hybrid cultivar]
MEKVGDWGPRVHVRPADKRRIELGPWARGSGGGASGGRPHPGPEDWVRVLRGGVAASQRQLGRRGGRERDRYEAGRQQGPRRPRQGEPHLPPRYRPPLSGHRDGRQGIYCVGPLRQRRPCS